MIRSESKVAQTNGQTVWYRNIHMLTESRPLYIRSAIFTSRLHTTHDALQAVSSITTTSKTYDSIRVKSCTDEWADSLVPEQPHVNRHQATIG